MLNETHKIKIAISAGVYKEFFLMLVTLISFVSNDPNSLTVNYMIVYANDL